MDMRKHEGVCEDIKGDGEVGEEMSIWREGAEKQKGAKRGDEESKVQGEATRNL